MMRQVVGTTRTLLCIAVLLVLAATLLRLYRLEHESLWWDEYASHVFLDAPTLREFLDLNHTLDPLSLPVYFSIEYFWARYAHDSVYGLRLLSIGLSLLTLPFVFALGRRLYGPWAGGVAVLLLVLSPAHIHHAQGIRMYALFILLAAVMVWSFIRLREAPRTLSWILHLAASLLLYWTHPMAGLVSAALGAWLLLNWRGHKTLFIQWTAAQAVLFAPTVWYLSRVRFWPQDTTGQWMESPSISTLLADIFYDDISGFHWQFRFGPLAERLGGLRLVPDLFFALLITALLLYLALRACRDRARGDKKVSAMSALLGLWLVLPPLTLFVVSWLWRPCMFPRYTAHCSLALYLLLGGAVQHIGNRRVRVGAVCLLTVCMLLQWLWLQPGPQRTDWRAAAQLIHAQAGPGDIVVVENTLWRDVFVHNTRYMSQGLLPIPVAAARGERPLAAATLLYLGIASRQDRAGLADDIRVWVVYGTDYFDPAPLFAFEDMMAANGLVYERRFFSAIRNIHVYAVRASKTASLPGDVHETLALVNQEAGGGMDHHMMHAFGDMATELAEYGHADMALAVLDGLLSASPFADRVYGSFARALRQGASGHGQAAAVRALWEGYGHRENRHMRHAAAAFARAAALDPNSAIAHLELATELVALGGHRRAADALIKASGLDEGYRDMTANLIQALQLGEGVGAAFEAVRLYQKGILALSGGDFDTAERLLRQALDHDAKLQPAHATL